MEWLAQFEGQIETQPPVSQEHLSQLPAKRGLALLLAENDHPIVLLPCGDIRSRVAARMRNPQEDPHQKMPDLRGVTRKILWKLTGGHFETDWTFLEIARRIWPSRYAGMLAIKKAWFVHVNPAEEYPRFVRSDNVWGEPGLFLGPFASGRSAERFVEAVQDAFDLCRDYRCLRQSPHGARCSYGQMGRCLCPCDGTIPMDQYRQVVARAADYAAGNRRPLLDELKAAMRQAAGKLEFERASTIKLRLDRLSAVEHEDFRLIAPAERFQFLLIQPAVSRGKANVFLADCGQIHSLPPLTWPLEDAALAAVLESGRDVVGKSIEPDLPLRQWRMAMASHYLYCSIEKSGLILRFDSGLTAQSLGESVATQAEVLRLVKAKVPPQAQEEVPPQVPPATDSTTEPESR